MRWKTFKDMFYEYVSEGQAKQWLEGLKESSEAVLCMELNMPIEVESVRGGYADAKFITWQCKWDREVSVQYLDENNEVVDGGGYDYNTAVDLMQIEVDAGNGAECWMEDIDVVN